LILLSLALLDASAMCICQQVCIGVRVIRRTKKEIAIMETNLLWQTNIVAALTTVTSDPSIQVAFADGLYFGFTVLAFCFGIWMLRTIPGDDREEP
jgi:hypothetical protein